MRGCPDCERLVDAAASALHDARCDCGGYDPVSYRDIVDGLVDNRLAALRLAAALILLHSPNGLTEAAAELAGRSR